ncbi:MAG: cytochrome-c oxidase [Verrucomicrobiales bacterium]|nr:cytochrome-c oxidase [Verrucomicrobiales bacterium]
MSQSPLIFLGLLFSFALSWMGIVFAPQLQLGREDAVATEAGINYPSVRRTMGNQGEEVYRQNGCIACHSQQVRPRGYGGDIQRGWGIRRTVAQDYLRDEPPLLGTHRFGPDLANIGIRGTTNFASTSAFHSGTNSAAEIFNWHLTHLYNPQITSPGSIMPGYPYLFTKRQITGRQSDDALVISGSYAPEKGYEIVPRPEAYAMVNYLLSLHSDVDLFEAPLPPGPTNALKKATNGVGKATNNIATGTSTNASPGNTNVQGSSTPAAAK